MKSLKEILPKTITAFVVITLLLQFRDVKKQGKCPSCGKEVWASNLRFRNGSKE